MTTYIRLAQRCRYGGQVVMYNTFHFASDDTGFTAPALATDWATNIVPTWKANVRAALTFESVETMELYPNWGEGGSAVLSGAGSSVLGTDSPSVQAMVITWRTGLPGRQYRGRTYLGGIGHSLANVTSWSTTALTAGTNIATVIKNRYMLGGNPIGAVLGVWSRLRGGVSPPLDPDAYTAIQSFTVQAFIATMGSRRGGRGM